jgi:hypothetical protein
MPTAGLIFFILPTANTNKNYAILTNKAGGSDFMLVAVSRSRLPAYIKLTLGVTSLLPISEDSGRAETRDGF